jgi:heme-degrading monooxygenase HmoA
MFIHMVLFRIKRRDVPTYLADCRLWEREAKRHAGFLGYRTLFRTNEKDQYASFYMWKTEPPHHRFMKKHHDRLVSLSRCPVEVLGYFNFNTRAF